MDRQECIRMLKIERDKQRENEADTKVIDMYNTTIKFLISDEEMMINMAEIIKTQDEVIERSTYYGERKEV